MEQPVRTVRFELYSRRDNRNNPDARTRKRATFKVDVADNATFPGCSFEITGPDEASTYVVAKAFVTMSYMDGSLAVTGQNYCSWDDALPTRLNACPHIYDIVIFD